MATGKSFFPRPKLRFLPAGDSDRRSVTSDAVLELDESDFFNSSRSESPEFRRPAPSTRISKRNSAKVADAGDWGEMPAPASLPVNIPDWSKILRSEKKENRRERFEEDDEEEIRVPPHEFLAKTRIASFSVHEGIGRTLKGRDLSRVRNAIWQKTGFED